MSDISSAALTAQIVSAYVANNPVRPDDLPGLINQVRSTLNFEFGPAKIEELPLAPVPAVPIKKSVTPKFIICLEDGKKFKSLKRHLSSAYGMTPEQYRAKWGLDRDYPMVAPEYAARRSQLAKDAGLGIKRVAA